MLMCGAKREYNVSEWKKIEQSELTTLWHQNHVLEKYYWSTCIRKNPTFQPRWKSIFLVIFAAILFMCLLLNSYQKTTLLSTASSNPPERRINSCSTCNLVATTSSEGSHARKLKNKQPVIVLDYEAEIAEEEPENGTTIKPPPKLPDAKYLKNLSQPRPPADFSITPWKVIERLREPVQGKDCKHMKSNKRYIGKWSLIIMVKSTSSNHDRRSAIRDTWGRVYFLNQIRIEKVFVVGQADDPTVQEAILAENDIFGDILQFEGPDDYKNMPIKVTTAMQWAAANLAHDDFYASADDDFVVDFVSIVGFLEYQVKLQKFKDELVNRHRTFQATRASMPIFCVYYLDKVKGPNRDKDSKWFINETEYSLERYPPYCGGGFYMMPVSMAFDLYETSRVTRVLAMDDVWVTGILRQKLGRGDDNVVKVQWPLTNTRDPDETKVLWKHLWGDYGTIKKDIAKLLPEAWKEWFKRLQGRPHCMIKEIEEADFELLPEQIETNKTRLIEKTESQNSKAKNKGA